MSERNLTEYIDAYLDDILTGSEREAFQQKMQEDPGFSLEVEAQMAVRLLVLKVEKRNYFRQLEEELFNSTALIDRYLEGVMSESELQWFEQKLAEDEKLQQDVKAQQMIIEAVQRQEVKKKFLDLEKEIEEEEKEEQKDAPVIHLSSHRNLWMAIAASVAILISVAAVFFLNRPQDQVIASYSIDVDGTALGYAGSKQSMEVIIMKSDDFPLHYTLQNDSLTVYLEEPSISKKDIQIEYDPSASPPYMLILKGQNYLLDFTSDQPQPLGSSE